MAEGIIHELAEGALGAAAWETAKLAFKTFMAKGTEQVAQYAAEALVARLVPMKLQDEVAFNAILNQMHPNDKFRLEERLAQLKGPRQRNLYRLTVLNDNPAVMLATMTRDAQSDDATWSNHVTVMGYADDQIDRFVTWWTDWNARLQAPGGAVEVTRTAADEMQNRATSVWRRALKGK